jgi:beta-barrel assembly-enhancing protease
MQAMLDKRFADVIAAHPDWFDVEKAAERQLAQRQAAMAAHPDRLSLVVAAARDLTMLRRYQDALELTEGARERIAHDPKDASSYVDASEGAAWIDYQQSATLFELGKVDDAIALRRSATTFEEGGVANVSQVINLAGLLVAAGRSDEALKVLDAFGSRPASPFGLGWVHATRACASERTGRTADVAADLAYLQANEPDNPAARLYALLCVFDLDAAAQEVIAQLHDPDRRAQALIDLSTFDPPPYESPGDAQLRTHLAAVAARPDVQAAIASVGRVETFRMDRERFIDLF